MPTDDIESPSPAPTPAAVCPKCGAERQPQLSNTRLVMWECGSDAWPDGGEFQQSDKCRIRELEQQLAARGEQVSIQVGPLTFDSAETLKEFADSEAKPYYDPANQPPSPLSLRQRLAAAFEGTTQGEWVDADTEDCTHPVIDDETFGPHRMILENDYRFAFAVHFEAHSIIAALDELASLKEKWRRHSQCVNNMDEANQELNSELVTANLRLAEAAEKLKIPHPARDFVNEFNVLLAAKDRMLAGLREENAKLIQRLSDTANDRVPKGIFDDPA